LNKLCIDPDPDGGEPVPAERQEDILDAALASLTERDIPPDEAWGWPDPDSGRPAELASLADRELAELLAVPAAAREPVWPAGSSAGDEPGGGRARAAEALPAGVLPRDGSGGGPGFADGGPLDVLAPGVPLAGFAEDAHAALAGVDDDALIGVLRGWQRVASWATARKLAAVAELARRRPADRTPPAAAGGFPAELSEFVADEVAAALTLTVRSAEAEVGLALDLAVRLPGTGAALAAGLLDLTRVKIITSGTVTLTDAHAAAVEARVLPGAPAMTAGRLQRAVRDAVLAADPDGARKQREESLTDARVEAWLDPAGTANLAGRNLPAASVLAADKRLCQVAAGWKKLGAPGGMDLLRARAYLALLLGLDTAVPPADLLPPAAAPGSPAPGRGTSPGHHDAAGSQAPPGLRHPDPGAGLPPLAASVHVTIPLTTLLGLSDAPGAAAGYGPIDPDTARALAGAAAGHPATRWHVIVTGPGGEAVGTGSAPGRGKTAEDGGWTVSVTAEPITLGECDHHNAEPQYRPSPALQRLIRARSNTCTYYGCGLPAHRCDLDHTVPYDEGITCECNLAPLCRRHHRMKQAEGWELEQICPGVMAWLTPAGRRYITTPSKYPT
jgi:hypothetical protein